VKTYTREELKNVLDLHQKWLNGDESGVRANLSWTNLSGANLCGANLSEAILSEAILSWTNLSGAILSGAILSGAYLWDTIGNGKEVKTLQTNRYTVTYTKDRIQIGCKNYSHSEWFNFSDKEISVMDRGALEWWNIYKPIIKTLIDMESGE
jgi:uncharacterized protein YjbI with pentapeptide repeats